MIYSIDTSNIAIALTKQYQGYKVVSSVQPVCKLYVLLHRYILILKTL